jgi:hypothetical protein
VTDGSFDCRGRFPAATAVNPHVLLFDGRIQKYIYNTKGNTGSVNEKLNESAEDKKLEMRKPEALSRVVNDCQFVAFTARILHV